MTVQMTMEEFKKLESKSKELDCLKEAVCKSAYIREGYVIGFNKEEIFGIYRACGGENNRAKGY